MERKALANIFALALHDVLDAARNPTVIGMLAVCVFLTAVFSSFDVAGRSDSSEVRAFFMVFVFALSPAFTGSIVTLDVMAEERGRGVALTLVEAGAATSHIAAAKLIAALFWTLLTELVACLVLGYPAAQIAALLAFSVPATLPVLLVSLACGLLADDQMTGGALALPVLLLAIAPLLSFMSEGIRAVFRFLPMGSAVEVVRAIAGTPCALSPALAAVLIVVWALAAAALVVWAHRRYARDIADALERRAAA